MKKQRGSRSAGCFMLVVVPLTFFVLLCFASLFVGFVLHRGYMQWVAEFESQRMNNEYIMLSDESLKNVVEEKVDRFSKSQEPNEFVEFTVPEGAYLLLGQLSDSMPLGLEVSRGYVEASSNKWVVYFQLMYKDMLLPWASVDLQKDSIESTQIYITYICVGEYDLSEYGLGFIKDNVNSGINEALLLMQSGDLTGRQIENITLAEDGVVVKGRLQ